MILLAAAVIIGAFIYFLTLIFLSKDRLPRIENLVLNGMLVMGLAFFGVVFEDSFFPSEPPSKPITFLLVQKDLPNSDFKKVRREFLSALKSGGTRVATFQGEPLAGIEVKPPPPPKLWPPVEFSFSSRKTALNWVEIEKPTTGEIRAVLFSSKETGDPFPPGVEGSSFSLPQPSPPKIISSFSLPPRVFINRETEASAELLLTAGVPATVNLFDGGRLLASREVTGERLKPVRIAIPFRVSEKGHHKITLEVVNPAGDYLDQAVGLAKVISPPPVVYIAGKAGDGRRLTDLLTRWGYSVVRESAGKAAHYPQKPGTVIALDNIPVKSLGWPAINLLSRAVSQEESGLVIIGGEDSFGPGQYGGAPIERLLPVWMGIKNPDQEKHKVAIVVVMDTSGSMRCFPEGCPGDAERMWGPLRPERGPRIRKIEFSKQALLNLLPAMKEVDYFGILGVREAPYWEVEPGPLTDREMVENLIRGIEPLGGGINIYSGLLEASTKIGDLDADLKHLIVLLDTDDVDEFIVLGMGSVDDLLWEMRGKGITVSFIGIGFSDDQYIPSINRLSGTGGGYFYLTSDVTEIPSFLVEDRDQLAQRQVIRRHLTTQFSPRELPGLQKSIPIEGLFITEAKPDARTPIWSELGYPVFAYRRIGKGVVGSLSIDSGKKFAPKWADENSLPLWDAIFRAVAPEPPSEYRLLAFRRFSGAEVYLTTPGREDMSSGKFIGRLTNKTSVIDQPLKTLFPGIYSTDFDNIAPGTYFVSVLDTATDEVAAEDLLRIEAPPSRRPGKELPREVHRKASPRALLGNEERNLLLLLAAGLVLFSELYRRP